MSYPNILFLMSDEHRYDVLGYAGNDVVRTPRLDALAESGTIFTHAYTPSPICIPGRQAIMSGQLPRTCGVEKFGQDLTPGYMTYARRFGQYSYHTVAAGKLHHTGQDQMQGWNQRLGSEMRVADYQIEGRHEPSFAPFATSFPRTTWSGMFRRTKWSDTKLVLRAGVGWPSSHAADAYALQGALNFIRDHFTDPFSDRARPERPVLLKVSFNQPHYPYLTTQERFAYYLNRVEPYGDEPVFDHPFLSQRQLRQEVDVTERDLRRATAAYYGMVETVDEFYGQVLDALTAAGQDLDDWIILFTSDHGEMLGEHGIWEKQKFFEGSVRVPLFIRWPKGFGGGRTVNKNVNLCDLFATLCELAGIPAPAGLDSRSLVSLCEGESGSWHNESISQFGGRNLMIKQDALKYQYYGEDWPEVLFDLDRDPSERVNLIEDSKYQSELRRFRVRNRELGFGSLADSQYRNAGYDPCVSL